MVKQPRRGYSRQVLNGKETWVPAYGNARIQQLEQDNLQLLVENKLLKAQLQAQTERSDFIEDCIAEMATQVYGGV